MIWRYGNITKEETYAMIKNDCSLKSFEVVQDRIYKTSNPERISDILNLDHYGLEEWELEDYRMIYYLSRRMSYDEIYEYLLNDSHLSLSFKFIILQFIKKDIRALTELDVKIIGNDAHIEYVELIVDSLFDIARNMVYDYIVVKMYNRELLTFTDDKVIDMFKLLGDLNPQNIAFQNFFEEYYGEIDTTLSNLDGVFQSLRYTYMAEYNVYGDNNMFNYILTGIETYGNSLDFYTH